jgi:hypothetical protein
MNYIIIDNFFKNPDVIRERALSMEYIKSSKKTGWKGYRTTVNDDEIKKHIKYKLIEIDKKFENLLIDEIFFHYSLKENKNDLKGSLHKDATEWAGIIYLTPNPIKNCGTILHNDSGNLEEIIENVYNRFVFYNGKKLHGPEDVFGDNIENARFTLTIFANISKSKKTLI